MLIVVAKSVMSHLGPRILPPPHNNAQRSKDRLRRYSSMIHLCRPSALSSTKPNSAHGYLCAGQILGVRLAMLGCERLGIDDPNGLVNPKNRKRLVTFIEID